MTTGLAFLLGMLTMATIALVGMLCVLGISKTMPPAPKRLGPR